MRIRSIAVLAVILLAKWSLAAPPFAEKMPAGSFVYVGWAGADSCQPAYSGSHLKAVIDQSNFVELARQYLPVMAEKVASKADADELQKVLALCWKHPWGWSVSAGSSENIPNFIFMCDAGPDANALGESFKKLNTSDQSVNRVEVTGTTVIYRGKLSPANADFAPLSQVKDFQSAVSQPSSALAVYVNGAALVKKWDDTLGASEENRGYWGKVRGILGLGCWQSYGLTAGFDGRNWATSTLLSTTGPRTGLAAVIEPAAIDPALLAHIPSNANSVSVTNFDVVKLFDTLYEAVAARQQVGKFLDQAIGGASMALGRNLRRQILGPIGKQWVAYGIDGSVVILNKTTDGPTAKDALVSVTYSLSNLLNSQLQNGPIGTIVAEQTKIDGLTITSGSLGQFALCWAVDNDGILYVSGSPAAVAAAAKAKGDPKAEITQSGSFTTALTKLGLTADKAVNYSFSDLSATAPAMYRTLGEGFSKVSDILKKNGVEIPEIEAPAVEQIVLQLSPALSVTWGDDFGIHTKSIEPFPGSQIFGSTQAVFSAGGGAVAAGILMPAMYRARESALRVSSMSNQRQLCIAVIMYANNHHGQLPNDLGVLVTDGLIANHPQLFIRPGSDTTVPAEILTGTPQQVADWVRAHGDYEYFGKGKSMTDFKNPAQSPLVAEREGKPAPSGLNIGFVDGHVAFYKLAKAQKILDDYRGQLNPGEDGL